MSKKKAKNRRDAAHNSSRQLDSVNTSLPDRIKAVPYKAKKTSKNNKGISKRKASKSSVIIAAVLCVAVAVAVIILINIFNNSSKSELVNSAWVPAVAHNASGDEVDMGEIYNTNYTAYQGSLSFADDGTFEFWLSPGTPDDGTHKGKYTIKNDSAIDVTFDNGESEEFEIVNKNGNISSIITEYKGYKVQFVKQ